MPHTQDCGGSAAAAATPLLQQEGSDATLTVSRSALSGSSKAPFPPDRSFVNDFDWTKKSRDLPAHVRPIIEDNKVGAGAGLCARWCWLVRMRQVCMRSIKPALHLFRLVECSD